MEPSALATIALLLVCPLRAGEPSIGHKPVGGDQRMWVVVGASDSRARSIVADAGVSIEEVTPERVGGIASPRAVAELGRLGLRFTAQDLAERFRPLDFPSEDTVFHNYDRATAELRSLAGQAPELASLFSIGASLQGRALLALRLNTTARGQDASPKPGIVFLGTHHAREHLSTEVPLLLAQYLVQNRAKPEIATLLNNRDIYIVPMINPDGVEHDIEDSRYHMHRKNMRPLGDGEFGVDLNRNYGYRWGGGGASKNPFDETYRGACAFSEPETQAVKAFVEGRPNLKVLLSYHTFSELILYPWGFTRDPLDDRQAAAAYEAMAYAMGRMTGYTPKQTSDLYIASGDTTDWAWGERKIFSFTFELTPKSMWGGGFYPGARAIASTFAANLQPALYLIGLADDPYRAASALTAEAAQPVSGGR